MVCIVMGMGLMQRSESGSGGVCRYVQMLLRETSQFSPR